MQGLAIFELLAMAGDGALRPGWVDDYEVGLDAYAARDWRAAIPRFEAVIAARGGDKASEVLIERCRHHIVEPPPADWTPVSVLDGK
jgi:adenylate cyclase